MTSTKLEFELMGLERFAHLEDRIYRVAEAFKAVQKENHSLRGDKDKLKAQLESLQRQESSFHESLSRLEQERKDLRDRVERVLRLLASLEKG